MSKKEKYGFVYIWYDRKHKRFYIGCRWGQIDDGYVCSSPWMKRSFGHRPNDFKRRILRSNIPTRKETYEEEQKWLDLIKPEEIKPLNETPRYYNLNLKNNRLWYHDDNKIKTVGEKISIAKKGKKNGPYSKEHREAISKAKKAQKLKMTDEWKQKIIESKKGQKQSEESNRKRSESLKKAYADGRRKTGKAPKPPTMSREKQNELCSDQLKERWNDPDWKQNQLNKLSQGAQKRWANTTIEQRARVPMPSKEDLEQLYPGNPFAFIAKEFNTSPPTVKKWLRYYELLN